MSPPAVPVIALFTPWRIPCVACAEPRAATCCVLSALTVATDSPATCWVASAATCNRAATSGMPCSSTTRPRNGTAGAIVIAPAIDPMLVVAFFVLALILGTIITLPIGGADMPVVISLFNAFTGLAVGFEGYVLGNPALIIAGIVVGDEEMPGLGIHR